MRFVRNYNQLIIEQEVDFLLNSLNEASFDSWLSKAKNLITKIKNPADAKFLVQDIFQKLASSTGITKQVVLKHLIPILLGGSLITAYNVMDSAKSTGNKELEQIAHQVLSKKGSEAKQDWEEYAKNADTYLNRFPGSPISGKMLAQAAKKTFAKTGIVVPLEIALAQGQTESRLGTDMTHRNPRKNPFSVGEFDDRTVFRPHSTMHGVQAYYDLMAKNYLSTRTPEQLLKNFVNSEGKRYASDKEYEVKLRNQINFIKKFIDRANDQQG